MCKFIIRAIWFNRMEVYGSAFHLLNLKKATEKRSHNYEKQSHNYELFSRNYKTLVAFFSVNAMSFRSIKVEKRCVFLRNSQEKKQATTMYP